MTNEDNRKRSVMWLNKKGHARKLFPDAPRGVHLRLGLFILGVVVCVCAGLIVFASVYKNEIDLWAENYRNQFLIIIGSSLVMAGFGVWAIWFRKK